MPWRSGGRGLGDQRISAGPRVGRDFGNHAWPVGGQISLPLGERLELRPSGDLLFPKDERMGWQLNGDGAIRFGQGGGLYAGGGIAFARLTVTPTPKPATICSWA